MSNVDDFVSEINAAMAGEWVVVHSAPTAWIGRLSRVTRSEGTLGAVLERGRLWVVGDYAEVCPPKLPAKMDLSASEAEKMKEAGCHTVYIPVVTAIQSCAKPPGEK